MNRLIKKELEKVTVANISSYNETQQEFFIPQFKKIRLEENAYYLIKLDDSLLNLNDSAILASNWNRGTIPPTKYLKIDISQIVGKMLKVNSRGWDISLEKDLDCVWSGWLPIANIEVIKKL